jgi:hypothetical protein
MHNEHWIGIMSLIMILSECDPETSILYQKRFGVSGDATTILARVILGRNLVGVASIQPLAIPVRKVYVFTEICEQRFRTTKSL